MQFVRCDYENHADAIVDIFNDAILNSTALYEYKPRTLETMKTWFAAKQAGDFPVIGAVSDDGVLLGFASYGAFRAFPANKYSVEHSVYVHRDHRGQGIAKLLIQRLIEVATEQQYHLMIGVIDAANAGSIALHERFGFVHSGTIREVGFKFDRWLDVSFYQLILETPDNPVDG